MSAPSPIPPPIPPAAPAASPERTLRRLFLTLFLRGRGARGLQKGTAPKSVGSKLALTLFIYGFMGLFSLAFVHQPVFALSVYLHAMTFVFLGMFVAASAGEVLFNKEEADILLHRPVTARTMLWSKIRVLVEVSLWLAGAINLVGLFAGMAASDGGWLFPLIHALSTTLEALFCTGCVVLAYQLCLRWCGRERLEGLMTGAQVIISIAAVMGGQIVPRLMFHIEGVSRFSLKMWWISLLPPAWFAGLDDAVAGGGSAGAWLLAGLALSATALVLWLAFGKLARDYETGLQAINETISPVRSRRAGRRFLDALVQAPPLRWWLRDPVERASFLLTAAYLARDRDVKLRVYPGLAPMLIMPFIFLLQGRGGAGSGAFIFALSSAFLGVIPLTALDMLQYSQQWQAADIFRAAPLRGPASLCHGARRAALLFLTLPLVLMFGLILCLIPGHSSYFLLTLPGLVALPVYALVPGLTGATPLSKPTEEAKATRRGATMIIVMFISMGLAGAGLLAWNYGFFGRFLLVETAGCVILYFLFLRRFTDPSLAAHGIEERPNQSCSAAPL